MQFVPALQAAANADRKYILINDISIRQDPDQVFNNAHQLKVARRQLLYCRRSFFRVHFCLDVRLRLCFWRLY